MTARIVLWAFVFAGLVVILAGCSGPTSPTPVMVDFVIEVEGERFVLRTSDPETIERATDNMAGGNGMSPIGSLHAGNGGFNASWSWHMDLKITRFAEAAIEVCDGRPSYVEAHRADYRPIARGARRWSVVDKKAAARVFHYLRRPT
jgi:hypothetical protein